MARPAVALKAGALSDQGGRPTPCSRGWAAKYGTPDVPFGERFTVPIGQVDARGVWALNGHSSDGRRPGRPRARSRGDAGRQNGDLYTVPIKMHGLCTGRSMQSIASGHSLTAGALSDPVLEGVGRQNGDLYTVPKNK
jgi:hypothetical protein